MTETPDNLPLSDEISNSLNNDSTQIADALRISEIRYRRLFETARDGILILESECGQITDANPFAEKLLGYSRNEMIGKDLSEIGLLPDSGASAAAFAQIKNEGYLLFDDLMVINRIGEQRAVELVSNLYFEEGNAVIQCHIRDITERKRVETDLAEVAARNERIAETLQRSMLQASPTGMFSGISVETLYQAALNESQVGGDFFDAFALNASTVALVVGDVSGKGLSAAGRTAEVKYALRAFLHEYKLPDFALARLNDFICETHRRDNVNDEAFIVLALAVVDTANGHTSFSAAGAEPIVVLRTNGTFEQIDLSGRPLGILSNAAYTATTRTLSVGDTVIMATDGITEARRGKAFLGSDGMAKIAQKAGPDAPLQELTRSIFNGARSFASDNLHDDVCLLAARIGATP